jgi:WD40 repeat protein
MTAELYNIYTHCGSTNKISFDPSGTVIAAATSKDMILLITHGEKTRIREIKTVDESIQAVCFDPFGQYLVSSGIGNIYFIGRWYF